MIRIRVQLADFRWHRGEWFFYDYDFSDGWVLEMRLEMRLVAAVKGIYPRCADGRRAVPPEGCGGPQVYLPDLDRHEVPPCDVLDQVAGAVGRFLSAGEHLALDDEPGLAEALDCLEAYTRFRPEHCSTRLHRRLRA